MLRSLATVLAFVAFVSIFLWTFSKRQKKGFEEAANLPFAEDDDMPNKPTVESKDK